jgi:membrane protease YdiL (CAAX protease family)
MVLLGSRGTSGPAVDPEAGRVPPERKVAFYWTNGSMMLLWGGIVAGWWWWRGRGLDTLGLTVPPEKLAAGFALVLLYVAVFAWDLRRNLAPDRIVRTRARWRERTPFMPESGREIAHAMVMVVGAAVGEEILYRGFLISYIAWYTGTSVPGLAAAVLADGQSRATNLHRKRVDYLKRSYRI